MSSETGGGDVSDSAGSGEKLPPAGGPCTWLANTNDQQPPAKAPRRDGGGGGSDVPETEKVFKDKKGQIIPQTVALWIPSNRTGEVFGVKGVIIQRIKTISGAKQIRIVQEDDQATTPVRVAGSPEAVQKAGELVTAILEGRHEEVGFVREAVEVPESLKAQTGSSIGNLLKKVSLDSGARVQQADPFSPLIITGSPESVAEARKILTEEGGGAPLVSAAVPRPPLAGVPQDVLAALGLNAAAAAAAGGGPRSGGGGQVTTAKFEISALRVKDVLGVKGRNVKAIRMHSGISKIAIQDRPKGETPGPDEAATVTITGTPTAIELCKYMILSVAAGDESVIGNVMDSMEIDSRMISKVIGTRGEVISKITDESGAYLAVREVGQGFKPRITMTGPPEACAKARDMIVQFLASQGVPAAQLGNSPSAIAAAAAVDPYAQYAAQAQIQEAQIQAQLQEAQLQAQLQAHVAELHSQLAAQGVAPQGESGIGGIAQQDLQALLARLAQAGEAGPPAHQLQYQQEQEAGEATQGAGQPATTLAALLGADEQMAELRKQEEQAQALIDQQQQRQQQLHAEQEHAASAAAALEAERNASVAAALDEQRRQMMADMGGAPMPNLDMPTAAATLAALREGGMAHSAGQAADRGGPAPVGRISKR